MHAETKMSKVWTLPHIHSYPDRQTDRPTYPDRDKQPRPSIRPLPVWPLLLLVLPPPQRPPLLSLHVLLLWHALKSSQVSAVSHWIYWNFRFALSPSRRTSSLACPGLSFWPYLRHFSPCMCMCVDAMRQQNVSVVLLRRRRNNSVNVLVACGWQRSASGWLCWSGEAPSSANLNIRWASLFYYVRGQVSACCWVIFRP